jgi:ferric-dicitrate binding protein FerR (iron transport regulator)
MNPRAFDAWRQASRAATQAEQELLLLTGETGCGASEPTEAQLATVRELRDSANRLLGLVMADVHASCELFRVTPGRKVRAGAAIAAIADPGQR